MHRQVQRCRGANVLSECSAGGSEVVQRWSRGGAGGSRCRVGGQMMWCRGAGDEEEVLLQMQSWCRGAGAPTPDPEEETPHTKNGA